LECKKRVRLRRSVCEGVLKRDFEIDSLNAPGRLCDYFTASSMSVLGFGSVVERASYKLCDLIQITVISILISFTIIIAVVYLILKKEPPGLCFCFGHRACMKS